MHTLAVALLGSFPLVPKPDSGKQACTCHHRPLSPLEEMGVVTTGKEGCWSKVRQMLRTEPMPEASLLCPSFLQRAELHARGNCGRFFPPVPSGVSSLVSVGPLMGAGMATVSDLPHEARNPRLTTDLISEPRLESSLGGTPSFGRSSPFALSGSYGTVEQTEAQIGE